MAGEISTTAPTALTIYVSDILHPNGTVWNGTAFEAWVDGHYATYTVAMSQTGTSGNRSGNFPTSIPSSVAAGGLFRVHMRIQSGGSPAISDPAWTSLVLDWTGSAEAFVHGSATGQTTPDLTQAVPLNAASGTVGGALLVAEGAAIGKLVEDDVANTLTLYARDNTTILRVFNLVPTGAAALSRT